MKVKLTEGQLNRLITEELANKTDIKKAVADAIKHDKDVEAAVKSVAADVVKNLFKLLWQRNNFWVDDIKK